MFSVSVPSWCSPALTPVSAMKRNALPFLSACTPSASEADLKNFLLDAREQAEFQKACARFQYLDPSYDLSGMGELMGCTVSVMGHAGHRH